MVTIFINVFTNPDGNTSVHDIKKQLYKKKVEVKDYDTIYYPFFFSKWKVEYLSFFKKKRKATTIVAQNSVTGETSFSEIFPKLTKINPKKKLIIPTKYNHLQTTLFDSKETIRKYYIHHVRVWNLPSIILEQKEKVYLPYTILYVHKINGSRKQLLLLENSSGIISKINDTPVIKKAYDDLLFERREMN